jgi:hypothetical protein
MHHAFEDLGLMQKLALPRRITLKGKSGLLSDTESPARGWLAADGVSAPEGPYPPDFPDVIHWCSGPTAKFRIRVPVAGPVCVEIDCMNPLFEHQDVKIQIGDSAIEALCVPHTPPPAQFIIKIKTSFLKAGWCLMTLTMSQSTIPGQQEKRSLALIVKDIRVIADATISGRSTKPTIHSKAGTQRPSMQIRN